MPEFPTDDKLTGPDGWYEDPEDPTSDRLRYWTGSKWSSETRKATPAELPARKLGDVPVVMTLTAADRARARLDAVAGSRAERDLAATRGFEYSIVEFADKEAESKLNEAGSLGWEVIAVAPSAKKGTMRFYCKREVWASVDANGRASAVAPHLGPAGKAAGGGGLFAAGFYESGPDFDMDGDVDGGLIDSIGNLFG